MDEKFYTQMAALEERHWWFVARRRILSRLLTSLPLPCNAQILDAGCGTGGNLPMLAGFGQVYAMELDERAREHALKRGHAEIQPGCLPYSIPFSDRCFDLIALFDVLEHIEEDTQALRSLRTRLKPEGWLLMTVPAFSFLWSQHDEIVHHHRRYKLPGLCRVVRDAGYAITYASYFNFWLFPFIAGARCLDRLVGKGEYWGDDLTLPAPLVNQGLAALFASERFLLGRFSLPFGVSLLLLARGIHAET